MSDSSLEMAYVANVQEMVRSDPFGIPESFLLSSNEYENKPNISADVCHLSSELPMIDLSLLSIGHKEELHKLDQACKEWGFFQLVNHGVATEVLQEMKDAAADFFQLPLEEKNKIQKPLHEFEGYGQPYAAAEGRKLDWSDALFLRVFPMHHREPKFWPMSPKGFKEAIEAYSSEVKRVGEELLRSLSIVMGMEEDTLLGLHKEFLQALRVNYIPPCSMPDKVLGLSSHSDAGSITILMQQDNVMGLQIRKAGQWVPVKPIPNALVVNVGDAMEIWSNGKYMSVEHRAVTNENKSRISYASFIYPDVDAEIEPFDQMVESRRMYRKIKYGDYLVACFSEGKLNGKTHTEMVKIAS